MTTTLLIFTAIVIYVLSLAINLMSYDKMGIFNKSIIFKEDKTLVTMFFIPIWNTVLALMAGVFHISKVIRKIKFD